MALRYRIVPTALGSAGFVASEQGVRRSYLPQTSAAALRKRIHKDAPDAKEDARLLPQVAKSLKRYFDGRQPRLDVPLDFEGATPFERQVWQALLDVPFGETVTYADLARRIGKPRAARAVGMAMAHNRFAPIVPCHRVLRSDGRLGGFSAPGGLRLKRKLLALESTQAEAAVGAGAST
jgi:methylated-DNA-[protein]-cysteine S-methyltransferase